ncbi:MAG: hypothetical protein B1H07_00055 [Campylobacteraceae bacterium 4484_166]|nr:MAG: hypothetical protein B1H07_00055 [Campylobacteraceae bacterium 4484_166]
MVISLRLVLILSMTAVYLYADKNDTTSSTILQPTNDTDTTTIQNSNNQTQNNDITTLQQKKKLKYDKPKMFDFWSNGFDNFSKVYDMAVDKNNYKAWGWITASSLLLFKYDKEIIDEAKRLGKKWDIPPDGQGAMKSIFSVGPFPILQTGDSKGAYLYLIGDGSVHIGIMAGMYAHGALSDNNKSLNVSSQLAEGLIGVAITTQLLKHITGRESPVVRSEDTGKWRWFPNQKDYHNDVQKYDAYPSGHLATTMMSVTVLSENYPDNPYIKPIGWTAMGLLSFQMLNNEVHWASDYPLALAIGYSFGKVSASRQRDKARKNWQIIPAITNKATGLNVVYRF